MLFHSRTSSAERVAGDVDAALAASVLGMSAPRASSATGAPTDRQASARACSRDERSRVGTAHGGGEKNGGVAPRFFSAENGVRSRDAVSRIADASSRFAGFRSRAHPAPLAVPLDWSWFDVRARRLRELEQLARSAA
jgi:hypothetical protein